MANAEREASAAGHNVRADDRRVAGHYEILGETYAKFEFFEKGWNSFTRFLDVDKVDMILRRRDSGRRIYREVQVKFGKLFTDLKGAWERKLFDATSWRFFKDDEFASDVERKDFFITYVLAPDIGYQGDIFIFPVCAFVEAIHFAPSSKGRRRVVISRSKSDRGRWFLRRTNRRFDDVSEETCLDVSRYRRNFDLLRELG